MRQALAGEDSELWGANPELAITIWLSMPSGRADVVQLRSVLQGCMFGTRFHPLALAMRPEKEDVSVFHGAHGDPPHPHPFIYVGTGCASLRPTPWSCPFEAPTYSFEWCVEYVNSRVDAYYLLRSSQGKCLYCACPRPGRLCYGALLVNRANALVAKCKAGETGTSGDLGQLAPSEACADAGESDPDDMAPGESYAQCRDDVDWLSPGGPPSFDGSLSAVQGTPLVPRPVPWPDAWSHLVAEFRGSPQPLVWEVFAGTFGLTRAFQNEGWPVAPPIDVVIEACFNLPNPLFLAITVGFVSERRVLFLHLGPPCSSFSIALNSAWASAVRSWEHP